MSSALEEAKKSARLAAKRATDTAQGKAVEDWQPTGDPDLDARRAEAITELGRPLTAEESFAVASGNRHDYRPEPRVRRDDPLQTQPDEHPEAALLRQAAAKAAAN